MWVVLLSQIDASVATGWSAFGLAGLILYWLAFHHLPAKDTQLMELIKQYNDRYDAKEKQLTDYIQTSRLVEEKQRSDFKESLQVVVVHCKEESERNRK